VEALAVLASIVFVHELGHFSVARALGVHVKAFSVGFGPTLLSLTVDKVEYKLSLVPIGGYVAFPDDEPESPYEKDDKDLLRNRSVAQRAAVAVAGVAANCVFALALLTTQASTVGLLEQVYKPGVVVPSLLAQSAGRDAGLWVGDVILAVDSTPISNSATSVDSLLRRIASSPGKPLTFAVRRSGRDLELQVTPRPGVSGVGRLGITLAANSELRHKVATSLPQAVGWAAQDFVRLSTIVGRGLQQLVFNFEEVSDQISGPVAIVAVGAQVAKASDPAALLQFAAIVNCNLAIVNLLPLPALDGGFLVLLAIEGLRGEKLDLEIEQAIQGLGTLLLLTSGLFLIGRDLFHLAGGP
jgi:membrane-associated protease RseP (regulator of RpoE activity)